MTNKLMAGIDLHGNNLFCGIVDGEGRRVLEKKLPCDLEQVLKTLQPFKKRLEKVAVESTYNWYWLVDGLRENGYDTQLANPAGIQQYNGLKHGDDKSDALFLAELLRLKILPTGYIYDAQIRPVRDLLRRRMSLVQQRTSLMLSLKSLHVRTLGRNLGLRELKKLEEQEAKKLFTHPANQLIAGLQVRLMEQVGQSIGQIEKAVLKEIKPEPRYQVLQSLPGVGIILGMTIALETGEPGRFAAAGNYASYCRCVEAHRFSNEKKKGQNNRKCGNKYLAWAFVEAANFAKRYDLSCRRFFDRKAAQTNSIVATKALACKLAKAAWHMMKEQSPYDAGRIFPGSTGGSSPGTDLGRTAGKPDKGVGVKALRD